MNLLKIISGFLWGLTLTCFGIADLVRYTLFQKSSLPFVGFSCYGTDLLIISVGVLSLLFANKLWSKYYKRKYEIVLLKKFGKQITAKVVGKLPEKGFGTKAHRTLVVAEYQDPETNKTYTFDSEPVWKVPDPLASELTVYLHPKNPDIYFVQLSFEDSQKTAA